MNVERSAETRNGWQPIEMADTTYTHLVDLWLVTKMAPDGYRLTDCYWHPTLEQWTKVDDMRIVRTETVTHWMPLPGPPK